MRLCVCMEKKGGGVGAWGKQREVKRSQKSIRWEEKELKSSVQAQGKETEETGWLAGGGLRVGQCVRGVDNGVSDSGREKKDGTEDAGPRP